MNHWWKLDVYELWRFSDKMNKYTGIWRFFHQYSHIRSSFAQIRRLGANHAYNRNWADWSCMQDLLFNRAAIEASVEIIDLVRIHQSFRIRFVDCTDNFLFFVRRDNRLA